MVNSPSQKWEDGKLVERAQDARGAVEENTAQAVTGRPPDAVPSNSNFASRAKARGAGRKAVDPDDVEDKAVTSSRTATKRK